MVISSPGASQLYARTENGWPKERETKPRSREHSRKLKFLAQNMRARRLSRREADNDDTQDMNDNRNNDAEEIEEDKEEATLDDTDELSAGLIEAGMYTDMDDMQDMNDNCNDDVEEFEEEEEEATLDDTGERSAGLPEAGPTFCFTDTKTFLQNIYRASDNFSYSLVFDKEKYPSYRRTRLRQLHGIVQRCLTDVLHLFGGSHRGELLRQILQDPKFAEDLGYDEKCLEWDVSERESHLATVLAENDALKKTIAKQKGIARITTIATNKQKTSAVKEVEKKNDATRAFSFSALPVVLFVAAFASQF